MVVGWDPHFSYSRLVYASIALRELPGPVPLVATNTDCADHIGGGRMMPGTGGLAAALEVASGRKAVRILRHRRMLCMLGYQEVFHFSSSKDGPRRNYLRRSNCRHGAHGVAPVLRLRLRGLVPLAPRVALRGRNPRGSRAAAAGCHTLVLRPISANACPSLLSAGISRQGWHTNQAVV